MPHARGSRFPRTSESLRRKTAWSEGIGELGATPASSSAAAFTALLTTTSISLIPGLTLVRIRGYISTLLLQAGAAGDGYHLGFGIRLMTPEAVAIGITATPTPLADIGDQGWMYHTMWTLQSPETTLFTAPSAQRTIVIDSKSMRKVPIGYSLVGVIEGVEIGTSTVEWSCNTRLLDKLP